MTDIMAPAIRSTPLWIQHGRGRHAREGVTPPPEQPARARALNSMLLPVSRRKRRSTGLLDEAAAPPLTPPSAAPRLATAPSVVSRHPPLPAFSAAALPPPPPCRPTLPTHPLSGLTPPAPPPPGTYGEVPPSPYSCVTQPAPPYPAPPSEPCDPLLRLPLRARASPSRAPPFLPTPPLPVQCLADKARSSLSGPASMRPPPVAPSARTRLPVTRLYSFRAPPPLPPLPPAGPRWAPCLHRSHHTAAVRPLRRVSLRDPPYPPAPDSDPADGSSSLCCTETTCPRYAGRPGPGPALLPGPSTPAAAPPRQVCPA